MKWKSQSVSSDGSNFIRVGTRAWYLTFPNPDLTFPSIREEYFLKGISSSHVHRRRWVSSFCVEVTGQIVSRTVWTSIQADTVSSDERSDSDSKRSGPCMLFKARCIIKIADFVVSKFKLRLTYYGVMVFLNLTSFPNENFWCECEWFSTSLWTTNDILLLIEKAYLLTKMGQGPSNEEDTTVRSKNPFSILRATIKRYASEAQDRRT